MINKIAIVNALLKRELKAKLEAMKKQLMHKKQLFIHLFSKLKLQHNNATKQNTVKL